MVSACFFAWGYMFDHSQAKLICDCYHNQTCSFMSTGWVWSLEPPFESNRQWTSWKQSTDCLKIVQGLVNYPRYYPCAFREKICPPCWGYRFFYWSWPHLISSQIQPTPLEFPIFLHWPPLEIHVFFSIFGVLVEFQRLLLYPPGIFRW